MLAMLDRALNAAAHSEPVRVIGASVAAISISYAGIMESLRFLCLVLTIAYTAIKIAQALKSRDEEDD
jgi:hypothetical protein